MIRCFSLISNIDSIDLYVANIEVYLHLLPISHLGQSNILKSVLYMEKSAIGQQIILSRSIITQKRNLVTVTPSIKPGQVMNKSYNTGLSNMKILKMMKL